MKKALYLFVAVCLTALSASAQVTEKQLTGKWKLANMEVAGMTINYETKKMTFPPETAAMLSAEDMASAEAEVFGKMDEKSFYGFEFAEGSKVTFVDGEDRKEAQYSLVEKDGKQYMEGGPIGVPGEISMTDGKLRLFYDMQGQTMVMNFSRAK